MVNKQTRWKIQRNRSEITTWPFIAIASPISILTTRVSVSLSARKIWNFREHDRRDSFALTFNYEHHFGTNPFVRIHEQCHISSHCLRKLQTRECAAGERIRTRTFSCSFWRVVCVGFISVLCVDNGAMTRCALSMPRTISHYERINIWFGYRLPTSSLSRNVSGSLPVQVFAQSDRKRK